MSWFKKSFKPTKRKISPNPISAQHYYHIGISSLFIVVLTLFCKSMNYPLVIPLFLFLLGSHLMFAHKGSAKVFTHLGLLLFVLYFISFMTTHWLNISSFFIPVAGIAMLTMLLFNSLTMSFIVSLAGSIMITLVLGGDLQMMMFFFLGSLVGVYSVREARTRGQLIVAGVFVSIVNVVCLLLFYPDTRLWMDPVFQSTYLMPLALNGVGSAIFTFATLNVFEACFGVLTNFSLLELSDFNRPLLKRMIMEAPGTYHHSLVVSNLAEAAADGIGANALLTRVGAYYHDIGKMVKPEYFTENQLACGNVHDNIEPSMSRLVILNHVKEGMELAKQHNLNPIITNFIEQHHGTSLIYYFYRKSLEASGNQAPMSEENYRYPGPKPQTAETAILLLADSVEGATRSLSEHTPNAISDTVHKVVNNKFIDGQLDECPLTLTEINVICATFVRILSAMYHGRVKYPEKKNGSNGRKPAEKKPPQPTENQEQRSDNPPA